MTDIEKARAAGELLASMHRDQAQKKGLTAAAGYPRWNQHGVVDGPVQDFYFSIEGGANGVEQIGTRELVQFFEKDGATVRRLTALMGHLCGNPN